MVRVIEKQTRLELEALIEQIVAAGQMNRNQHFRLASILLADQQLTDKERCQINRVLDYVQTGRVKLMG